MSISIKAQGIGKQYIIGGAEQHYDSFREMLSSVLKSPLQKFKTLSGEVAKDNFFWALKDIDFEIAKGDVVGLIGHNGAGKSTLLKVLSRITPPTEGVIEIKGRVASLLEVGTGFHPELTGRENIYLNGSILGMRRDQINHRFDEIVEFADIERFLDTPVKRYSSGMYVRLAFSIAAHLDTDVLLVDEVLAVGDQRFQEKCLGKLEDVSSEGRTVIFVSHNLSSISKLCNKAMVLEQGQIVFQGDVQEGISVYNHQMRESLVLAENDYTGLLYPNVEFDNIRFGDLDFEEGLEIEPFKPIRISLHGKSSQHLKAYRSICSIRKSGQLIFSIYDSADLTDLPTGHFYSHFTIPEKLLLPGEYTCSFGGVTNHSDQWLWTRDYRFNVAERWAVDYDTTSTVVGMINLNSIGNRRYGANSNEIE